MASLGTLTLDLVAKIGGFTGPLDKASRQAKRSNKEISGSFNDSLKFIKTWGIGIAAGAGAATIAFTKSSLATADAIGKVAATAGVSTDTIQEMRHAASLSGIAFGDLDQGMQQFNKRVGELRAGTGALYTYLNKTNQSLVNQVKTARSTDEALDLIFKSMKDVASSSDRAALAAAAFGRSGQRISIMADDYERLRKEARDLGLVIDADLIKNAESANDKMDTMSRIIKTQLTGAFIELAPAIINVSQATIDATIAIKRFFDNGKIKKIDEFSRLKADISALETSLKLAEDAGDSTFVSITSDGIYFTNTIGSARAQLKSMKEDLEKLGKVSGNETSGALSEDKINAYKKALSSLETITPQVYEIIKSEYVKDRDLFIETTGDKETAYRIYAKNIEALNKKLIQSELEWREFKDTIDKTSAKNVEKLENDKLSLLEKAKAATRSLNEKQLQEDIAIDAAYHQLVDEANIAEISSKYEGIQREIALHEYKFTKLKQLYTAGSAELTQIERLETAERVELTKREREERVAETSSKLQNASAFFDNMASITANFGDKQKAIYKTMFVASKAIALADAIVHWHGAVAKATDTAPFPYNIPAIIGANIQGLVPVAGIIATTIQGLAHDGLDKVPETGTWLLKKGERVTTAETSMKLDNTLSRLNSNLGYSYTGNSGTGMSIGGKSEYHIHYDGPVFLNRSQMKTAARMFMEEGERERTRRGAIA